MHLSLVKLEITDVSKNDGIKAQGDKDLKPDQDAVVLRLAGEQAEVTLPLAEARDARLLVDWHGIETGRRET